MPGGQTVFESLPLAGAGPIELAFAAELALECGPFKTACIARRLNSSLVGTACGALSFFLALSVSLIVL